MRGYGIEAQFIGISFFGIYFPGLRRTNTVFEQDFLCISCVSSVYYL